MSAPNPGDENERVLRNLKAIIEAIPFAYKTVVMWGCDKPKNESFKDFLDRNQAVLKRDERKWVKNNTDKLNQADIGDVDVTFLFSLIALVCKGLCKPGTKEHETILKDTTSVEFLLKKSKQQRNDVIHEISKTASPTVFDEIKATLKDLLEAAGKFYKKSQTDIDEGLFKLTEIFNRILMINFVSPNKKAECLANMLVQVGWQERKRVWEQNCSKIRLPFRRDMVFERSSAFCHINLSSIYQSVGSFDKKTLSFSSQDLFKTLKSNVKIIQGVPGSGKTTLMKCIIEKWLKIGDTSWAFPCLEEYNLVILLECRSNSCQSFGELIKVNFPQTLSSFSETEIMAAVDSLNILVLIDGFDERQQSSHKILSSLIESCKFSSKRTLIFTSRPLAAKALTQQLASKELSYDDITIEGLNCIAEQTRFLRNYLNCILNVDPQSPKNSLSFPMIETFTNLPPAVTGIFSSPIMLTLFFDICSSSEHSARNLKTEIQVFVAIYEIISMKLKSRIEDTPNIESHQVRFLSNKLLRAICKLCFELIHDQRYYLTEEKYGSFAQFCLSNISESVNYDVVLSSVVSPELSQFGNQDISYHFYHAAIQEYLAAKHICEELKNSTLDIILLESYQDMSSKVIFQR